ncbi:Yft2 [Kluyveromyces lactis]|nr:Yft2 [Kluyveromyces lactis]
MQPDRIVLAKFPVPGDWWLHIYPALVFFGYFISVLIGEDELERERKEWYWISGRNVVNHLFAYKGIYIFDLLFGLLIGLQVYVRMKHEESLLPTSNGEQDRNSPDLLQQVGKVLKVYSIKFVLVYLVLWACFLFIDHLFVWTGGNCDLSDTKSAERCRSLGGSWVGGFDISGHFCFLTNISLTLWQELKLLLQYANQHTISWNSPSSKYQWIVLVVLCIWINVLTITSIYYHTFLEKVLGCAFGYSCLLVIYYILPRIKNLNKFLTL